MAVNKVQYGGTTLIDLTADTLTSPSQLAEGIVAHDRAGNVITGTASGGTSAISVVDTLDSHGGTVRTITALDISDTTAVAGDVAQGKYFYTADGTKTEGTATGGGSAVTVIDETLPNGATAKHITAVDISDTTAIASDVATGKYFYTADGTKTQGTASGGGSSYTLLAETDVAISTSSTSATQVTTINVPGIQNKRNSGDKILYFSIFDKAGMRNGHYYGSQTYMCYVSSISGVSYYVKANGTTDYSAITYGVYPNIGGPDIITIYSRFVSSFGTLDGTFHVAIYELDFPNSVSPFTT